MPLVEVQQQSSKSYFLVESARSTSNANRLFVKSKSAQGVASLSIVLWTTIVKQGSFVELPPSGPMLRSASSKETGSRSVQTTSSVRTSSIAGTRTKHTNWPTREYASKCTAKMSALSSGGNKSTRLLTNPLALGLTIPSQELLPLLLLVEQAPEPQVALELELVVLAQVVAEPPEAEVLELPDSLVLPPLFPNLFSSTTSKTESTAVVV